MVGACYHFLQLFVLELDDAVCFVLTHSAAMLACDTDAERYLGHTILSQPGILNSVMNALLLNAEVLT
jgi:hypothetical protein